MSQASSRASSPSGATEARRPSLFGRLRSSAASIISTSPEDSTSSGLVRARYARDGKGHDFNDTYTYSKSTSSSGTSTPLSSSVDSSKSIPIGNSSFYLSRAHYAKDGRGHDFSTSYISNEDANTPLVKSTGQVKYLYAKDGKGFDFTESYKFTQQSDGTMKSSKGISLPRSYWM